MTLLAGAWPRGLSSMAGSMVVGALWQSVALAAMVALCLRVARQTTATLRFALWAAALLLICLLPFVETTTASTPHAPMLHLDPRWSLVLAVVWLTLSFLRAADLVRHALRLRSLSREAEPVTLKEDLALLLRTHRNAQLCTSTRLQRPGVIGFCAPRILIPAWLFDQLTAAELEQIVLHELEHLRRRDDWLNLLQKLALVVFPLNPALHWIERRLCLERELACDEGVVRRTRAPRLYATCLARLAEHGLDHRSLTLALGFLERQSELARRVAGILHAPRTLRPHQSFALTGTVTALLLGGCAELARCPQLVSFATPTALASNTGTPSLAPEMWVSSRSAKPVVFTDAVEPHLLHAALTQTKKLLHHKAKTHRPHPSAPQRRAVIEQPNSAPSVATVFTQPNWSPAPPAPILVRYTLVRVDGGWLLLQL